MKHFDKQLPEKDFQAILKEAKKLEYDVYHNILKINIRIVNSIFLVPNTERNEIEANVASNILKVLNEDIRGQKVESFCLTIKNKKGYWIVEKYNYSLVGVYADI